MRKVADVEPVRVWARRANMASTSPRKMASRLSRLPMHPEPSPTQRQPIWSSALLNAISVHPYAG